MADSDRFAPAIPDELGDALRKFKSDIFRALAHPTRIQIIECLAEGELSVNGLNQRIPAEATSISQHLAILRSQHLVQSRKDGNRVIYWLRDPLLVEVLETMKRYFLARLGESVALKERLETEE